MVDGTAAAGVAADVGAGHDGGDPPAVRVRAAPGAGAALVPGQHEEAVRPEPAQHPREQTRQEAVARADVSNRTRGWRSSLSAIGLFELTCCTGVHMK